MKSFIHNLGNLRFRTRIVLLVVFCVVITASTISGILLWLNGQYNAKAQKAVDQLIYANLANLAQELYNLIEVQGETVQGSVDTYLKTAHYVLNSQGNLTFSQEMVRWQAVNQVTQETTEVEVPKVLIGFK